MHGKALRAGTLAWYRVGPQWMFVTRCTYDRTRVTLQKLAIPYKLKCTIKEECILLLGG